jgi:UDP-GlcNAc:undecaprenyl-phosphate/decaprenyl-phosphate GlcNAc-1-phosphate transferase
LNTYFALFLIATVASLVITPLIRRLCQRFSLLDVPLDDRRVHRRAIPRLGGVALYLSCTCALITFLFVDNLLTQSIKQHSSELFLVLLPATLVFLVGVYDDLRGANALVKFVSLGLIASLFFAMGGRVNALSVPFVGSVQLPIVVSYVVTLLWLVGIANAFNLIDGIDGLASGAALFASVVIMIVSIAQGLPLMIVITLVLCGSLAGFLRYNFNPASIFLGDSGALFVGFILAALSVVGTQKAATAVAVVVPILAFGFPVVDTAMTMSRRLVSRRPIFEGDNEHIHHMLLARGWSQRKVVLVLYGVCASFGLAAVIFPATGSRVTGVVLFVVSVAIIIAVGHLRYHEVDEIKAGVRRTVSDRRLRVAKNIQVRRAVRALAKANDLYEVFEAMRRMLDFAEFTYANAQVGQAGRADVTELAYNASVLRHPEHGMELRNGRVFWSWLGDGGERDDLLRSRTSWCFRLPLVSDGTEWGWVNFYHNLDGESLLVDTNYLSNLFRSAFTEAVERIITHYEPATTVTTQVAMKAAAGEVIR